MISWWSSISRLSGYQINEDIKDKNKMDKKDQIQDIKNKISNNKSDMNDLLSYDYQNHDDIYYLKEYNGLLKNINQLIIDHLNKSDDQIDILNPLMNDQN